MKLALDHHYSPRIAAALQEKGHDVIAVAERAWETLDDEELLTLCLGERRTLLTNNVADFVAIVKNWTLQGQSHSGLVFTSDSSMPRGRQAIGRYVRELDGLLRSHGADDALRDQVLWL